MVPLFLTSSQKQLAEFAKARRFVRALRKSKTQLKNKNQSRCAATILKGMVEKWPG
jgi:hypothetical protein